jgi:hypothetical protein
MQGFKNFTKHYSDFVFFCNKIIPSFVTFNLRLTSFKFIYLYGIKLLKIFFKLFLFEKNNCASLKFPKIIIFHKRYFQSAFLIHLQLFLEFCTEVSARFLWQFLSAIVNLFKRALVVLKLMINYFYFWLYFNCAQILKNNPYSRS